jgi:hypothetical protein
MPGCCCGFWECRDLRDRQPWLRNPLCFTRVSSAPLPPPGTLTPLMARRSVEKFILRRRTLQLLQVENPARRPNLSYNWVIHHPLWHHMTMFREKRSSWKTCAVDKRDAMFRFVPQNTLPYYPQDVLNGRVLLTPIETIRTSDPNSHLRPSIIAKLQVAHRLLLPERQPSQPPQPPQPPQPTPTHPNPCSFFTCLKTHACLNGANRWATTFHCFATNDWY